MIDLNDSGIIGALIDAAQALVVAVIGGLFIRDSRKRKTRDAHTDKRAEIRAEESRLSMALMSANTSLTIATALAVKEGKTNGKMTAALSAADHAQRDYYSFINRIASTQMTED